MKKILGYGEDAFTLWALKNRGADFLEKVRDKTLTSNCLFLFRPSFGRSGGEESSEFGEFDAIVISLENVYLIESKWDNFSEFENQKVTIKQVQRDRHKILQWYLTHWDQEYTNDWKRFMKEYASDFEKQFSGKPIAPANSLLAKNLQSILNMSKQRCRNMSTKSYIKNILLFFYNGDKSTPPDRISGDFQLISIDYSQETVGNFIPLYD